MFKFNESQNMKIESSVMSSDYGCIGLGVYNTFTSKITSDGQMAGRVSNNFCSPAFLITSATNFETSMTIIPFDSLFKSSRLVKTLL